ncbi:hypothetical protein EJB05_39079 [Eragrostis curvula]|uniref:DNA topoisomerase 2 n=1 Tax=Eragrostis curvula TaxID=38414 RepID=A0A5J9TW34_9POAL|nr:hypothetical protein EJB05_39079 [Eragrostis curvula]
MDPHPRPRSALSGKSLREQILLQPKGYIGSVEKRTRKFWLCEGIYDSFVTQREVTYVPGLLKIVDEVLIYAADNKQRDHAMDTIRVDVNVAKCRISVYNNGKCIPIEVHPEEGVYVLEMIFGHLSGKCDRDVEDDEMARRRSGYGVKLANIFSTEFIVETADGPGQKKYKQVFSENMGKKSEPEITGYRKGVNWSWTMVTFKPDLAKFNMTCLDDDIIALMRKRLFDMAGILGVTVQVVFNGENNLFRGFTDFVCWHTTKPLPTKELPWFCEKVNDQWEVGVSVSEGKFQQVSFVNKVATISGGTHVDYVSNLIVAHAVSFMKNEFQWANIKDHDLKRHLMVFINLHMENPTFCSLTKEALTTPQEDFGPELKFSDRFLGNATGFLMNAWDLAKRRW